MVMERERLKGEICQTLYHLVEATYRHVKAQVEHFLASSAV
jgi:hypothetical protein